MRDSAGTVPNLPGGLLNRLAECYGQPVTAEDVAAYVYAVLAHPGYREVFTEGLERPGPRVPVTKDPFLFQEAVGLGERLLWLQTYAERYRDPAADRAARVPGLGWSTPVTTIPIDMTEISYDEEAHTLHVGDGTLTGVLPEVWAFTVSGFPVVERWLGSRTA